MQKRGPARINFSGKKLGGFTLIELLVVIAIIGILASVVMVSLSSARNKAKDAKIKSNLASARVDSEIYYDENDSFMSYCSEEKTDGTAGGSGIKKYLSTLPTDSANNCYDNDTSFAMVAHLNSNKEKCWCVDSFGYQGEIGYSGSSCQSNTPEGGPYHCQ